VTPDQTFEVTKSLGIAAPLVVVLLYLLRLLIELLTKATDERKTITAQFVDAMKTTATTSAVAQQQAAASLQELAAAGLVGTRLEDDAIAAAADAAHKLARPMDNTSGTLAQRKRTVPVFAARALAALRDGPGDGGRS